MANWFEDLVGGMGVGANVVDAVQRNKARKMAEQVAQQRILGPMQQDLGLKWEEKSGVEGLLWNLGIGDPPQLLKSDARMAAEQDAAGGPVSPVPTAAETTQSVAPAGDAPAGQAGGAQPDLGAAVPSDARKAVLAGLNMAASASKRSTPAPKMQAITFDKIDSVKATPVPHLATVAVGNGMAVPSARDSRWLALLKQPQTNLG